MQINPTVFTYIKFYHIFKQHAMRNRAISNSRNLDFVPAPLGEESQIVTFYIAISLLFSLHFS